MRLAFGTRVWAALSLIAAAVAPAQTPSGAVVNVTGGRVQGRPLPSPGGMMFQGIPYAAPPVGPLRWREPQPVKPWQGVLQAGGYRTGCGQTPPGQDDTKVAEEDCLYLNVWAPEWPAKSKKPVMFWINGGGLLGSSGALRAGADSLTRHGVILVSANYRGTLLGMMGHAELTAESPHKSSGNYGLHDEVAVLRWIKANIAKFGGDPNNVTIFGQSGGAHIISMLMTAPSARGLFHKAAADSGAAFQGPRPYLHLPEAEQIGAVTAELLGAPKENQLRWLRAQPAAKIVQIVPAVRNRLMDFDGLIYDQVTDGFLIPHPPGEVWAAGRQARVPLMIGLTSQDTAGTIRGAAIPGPQAPAEAVLAYKEEALRLFYPDPVQLQQAREAYGIAGGGDAGPGHPFYGSSQLALGTDLNHRCGTVMGAAAHSRIAPTWLWEFSRTTPGQNPVHGAELRYIFGYADLASPEERAFSQLMQRYWTNFAKTGNPNGEGLPNWPAYDTAMKTSLELANEGAVLRTALREKQCQPYFSKYRDGKALTGGKRTWVRGPV